MSTVSEAIHYVNNGQRWRRNAWPENIFIAFLPAQVERLVLNEMACDIYRCEYIGEFHSPTNEQAKLGARAVVVPYTPTQYDLIADDWERYGT